MNEILWLIMIFCNFAFSIYAIVEARKNTAKLDQFVEDMVKIEDIEDEELEI